MSRLFCRSLSSTLRLPSRSLPSSKFSSCVPSASISSSLSPSFSPSAGVPVRHISGARRARNEFDHQYMAPSGNRTSSPFISFVYANLMRSNAVFVATIVGAGIIGGVLYDEAFEELWRINNKGKLFDEVVPSRFPNLPPGCEGEDVPEATEAAEE